MDFPFRRNRVLLARGRSSMWVEPRRLMVKHERATNLDTMVYRIGEGVTATIVGKIVTMRRFPTQVLYGRVGGNIDTEIEQSIRNEELALPPTPCLA